MNDEDNSLKDELLRVKNQWFLVSCTAVLYLYLSYIYFISEEPEGSLLGKIFLYAIVLKGLTELGSILFYSRKIILPISIGPIYDVSFAALLYVFPLIAVIILPFYLALSEWVRSACSIYIYQNLSRYEATNLYWLNAVAWLRIVLGVLVVFTALINNSLLGFVFLSTAVVLIYFVTKLRGAGNVRNVRNE